MSNKELIRRIAFKVKPEKRYTIDDLTIRYDNEDKRICIFKNKSAKKKKNYIVEYEEEKIEDGSTIIYTKGPGFHHSQPKYRNSSDRDRYEIIYIIRKSLMQLFGEDFKGRSFTIEELKELEKQINEKAKSAFYREVYTLKLDDSYTGKARKLSDNELHIAKKHKRIVNEVKDPVTGEIKYVIPDLICIEKEYINIKVDDDNNLIIGFNNKMNENGTVIETIKNGLWRLEKLTLDEIKNFEYFSSPFTVYTNFCGFSRTALRKILDRYKDKQKQI